MFSRTKRFRVLALGAIVAGLGTLPGCQGLRGDDPATVPHSAYRPAFGATDRKKTLFLGGYAGYNYGPVASQSGLATASGGDTWGYPVARPPFAALFGR
jgi:hypothetical protein